LYRSRSAAISRFSASRNSRSVRRLAEVGSDDLDAEAVAREPTERRFVADLAAPEPVVEEAPAAGGIVGAGLARRNLRHRLEPLRVDGGALGGETELHAEDVGGVHRRRSAG